jgi:hypothetical protein
MMVFVAIPACLLRFSAGCPEPSLRLTQDAMGRVNRMSRNVKTSTVSGIICSQIDFVIPPRRSQQGVVRRRSENSRSYGKRH